MNSDRGSKVKLIELALVELSEILPANMLGETTSQTLVFEPCKCGHDFAASATVEMVQYNHRHLCTRFGSLNGYLAKMTCAGSYGWH